MKPTNDDNSPTIHAPFGLRVELWFETDEQLERFAKKTEWMPDNWTWEDAIKFLFFMWIDDSTSLTDKSSPGTATGQLMKLAEQTKQLEEENQRLKKMLWQTELHQNMVEAIAREMRKTEGIMTYTREDTADEYEEEAYLSEYSPADRAAHENARIHYGDEVVKTTEVTNVRVREIRRLVALEKEDIPAYFLFVKIDYDYRWNDDPPSQEEARYLVALDKDEDMLLDCLYKCDIDRGNPFEDCWIGDIAIEELTTEEVEKIIEKAPIITKC